MERLGQGEPQEKIQRQLVFQAAADDVQSPYGVAADRTGQAARPPGSSGSYQAWELSSDPLISDVF